MYIWMMLATFIVMLAAFNLSPRTDIEKQQMVPLAEAAVVKFLSQHNAAIEYATKITKQMKRGEAGFAGSVTQLTGCNNAGEGDLCPHLPIGYHYTENAYYSSVYCLNGFIKDADGQIIQLGGQNTEDCMTGVRYVISFGRVPQRWKNVSTNKILAPYYKALYAKLPLQALSGIVIPKVEGDEYNTMESDYIIQGNNLMEDSIPPYFLGHDTNFRNKCLHGGSLDPKFPCVIFISKVEL